MKKQCLPIIRAIRPTLVGAAFGIACGSKALMARLEFVGWPLDRRVV